jgi:hypothetical protein
MRRCHLDFQSSRDFLGRLSGRWARAQITRVGLAFTASQYRFRLFQA